mmetsp:Transcript_3898/g.7071  ORF Transcript_3898/g.7071 Transcript_3898/m.7071 type:complete len:207 (+) Transcript_3898:69-689(+)
MDDLDRPLDEIIQDELKAKRTQRQGKEKKHSNTGPRSRRIDDDGDDDYKAADAPPRQFRTSRGRGGPRFGDNQPRNFGIAQRPIEKPNTRGPPMMHRGMDRYADRSQEWRRYPERPQNYPPPVRRHPGYVLRASNLAATVTNADIFSLFEPFGKIKRALLLFDKETGEKTGEAEVVFEQHEAVLNAIKEYSGISLDGKPLQLRFLE